MYHTGTLQFTYLVERFLSFSPLNSLCNYTNVSVTEYLPEPQWLHFAEVIAGHNRNSDEKFQKTKAAFWMDFTAINLGSLLINA